jgi:tetratricopeptide (TPR) repeat protein
MRVPNAAESGAEILSSLDTLLADLLAEFGRTDRDVESPDVSAVLEHSESLLRAAEALVQRRASEISLAIKNLSQARARIRFTSVGWNAERARIEDALASPDRREGIRIWLTEWATAAGECRWEALERLSGSELTVPGSLSLVRERLSAAAHFLPREPSIAAPFLTRLANGASIGKMTMVGAPARASLHLLLARLALGSPTDPDAALRAASEISSAADLLGESPSVVGARAAMARRTGNDAEAARIAEEVRQFVSVDLAALVEQVHWLAGADPVAFEQVMSAGVTALVARNDIASEVERLCEPLPARVWIRIAMEGLRVKRQSIARMALDAIGTESTYAESAQANELRAELYRQQGASGGVIAEELVAAARNYFWWVSPPVYAKALSLYEEALALDSSQVAVKAELSDLLRTLADGKAFDEYIAELTRALEVVHQAQEGDPSSYAFQVEAAVLMDLMDNAPVGAAEYRWRAGLAVLRAIALDAERANPWRTLAIFLREADILDDAAIVARFALAMEDDTLTREDAISAMANAERFEDALELLDDYHETSSWSICINASILSQLGRETEAVELFRKGVVLSDESEPIWWGWRDAMEAAERIGQVEWAHDIAEELWKRSRKRKGNVEAMEAAANAALELGHPHEAERISLEMLDADPSRDYALQTLAFAQLLQGHAEKGLDSVRRVIATESSMLTLDGYSLRIWPRLERWAARTDVQLPPLESIQSALTERRAILESKKDLWLESIERVPLEQRPLAEFVSDWARSAVDYARGHYASAARWLARAKWTETPPELDTFRVLIIMKEFGEEPAAAIQDVAEPVPDGVHEPSLRLQLPQSWFRNLNNREFEGDVVSRFLSELRIRASVTLPLVTVSAHVELEPDKYRILADEAVLEDGRIRTDVLFAFEESLSFMADSQIAVVAHDAREILPGLVSLDTNDLPEDEGLKLFLMEPAEVVVRRLGRVYEDSLR